MSKSEMMVNNAGFPVNKRRNKWVMYSLVGLLLIGGGTYSYEKIYAQSATTSNMLWATVKRGDVTETVSATGTVQASKQASLSFAGGSGQITAVNVQVGDHVKAGQVLATLDDSTERAQIANAQANLTAAKAKLAEATQGSTQEDIAIQQANVDKANVALQNAQTAYQTQQKLFASGAAAKNDVDQAKNTLDQEQASYNATVAQLNQVKAPPQSSTVLSAQAAVEQAQASLQQEQTALDKLTLKAPMDGVITQVNGNVGEVAPNSAFIVMDNSDSGNLEVAAQVSQSDIGKVKQGMKATFTTSTFTDKTFTGQVSLVYPEATTDSGVTTYKVILTADNKEGLLKPGMTMNVTVEVGTHNNVLVVPAAALKDQNGKDGVYLKVDSSAGASSGTINQGGSNQMHSGQQGNSSTSTGNGNRSGRGFQQGNFPYRFQPVTIGYYSTNMVEITSGLKEGDQIVLSTGTPAASSSSSNKKSSNGLGGIPGMGGGFGGGYGGGAGGAGGGMRGKG